MKIAIQANPSRGKEIISLLESLGGRNGHKLCGHAIGHIYHYHIDNTSNIIALSSKRDLHNCKFYTLEEFEKEFPFKIGDKVTIVGIPDFPKTITKMEWDCDEILYSFEGLVNTWFGAKALKKFEMKEERNITLTLDKAKEWYKKGGELKEIALQAYSEEELTKVGLPKTWEEFRENNPVKAGECWLAQQDIIHQASDSSNRIFKNWIPSKKSAEAHLAMIQLEQLRNCWWNGWEPKWNNCEKYVIKWDDDDLIVFTAINIHAFLVFPTREMAEEFLECFRDLIEKAGDLI